MTFFLIVSFILFVILAVLTLILDIRRERDSAFLDPELRDRLQDFSLSGVFFFVNAIVTLILFIKSRLTLIILKADRDF